MGFVSTVYDSPAELIRVADKRKDRQHLDYQVTAFLFPSIVINQLMILDNKCIKDTVIKLNRDCS